MQFPERKLTIRVECQLPFLEGPVAPPDTFKIYHPRVRRHAYAATFPACTSANGIGYRNCQLIVIGRSPSYRPGVTGPR